MTHPAIKTHVRGSAMVLAMIFIIALTVATVGAFNGLTTANDAIIQVGADYDLHFAAVSTLHQVKSQMFYESLAEVYEWIDPPLNTGTRIVRRMWEEEANSGFRDPEEAGQFGDIVVDYQVADTGTGIRIEATATDPVNPLNQVTAGVNIVISTPAQYSTYWNDGLTMSAGFNTDGEVRAVGFAVEKDGGDYRHEDDITVSVRSNGTGGKYWSNDNGTRTFDDDYLDTPITFEEDFDPSEVPAIPGYAPFEDVTPIAGGVEPLNTEVGYVPLPSAEGDNWTTMAAAALDPEPEIEADTFGRTEAFYTRRNTLPTYNNKWWEPNTSTRWRGTFWYPSSPPSDPPDPSAPNITQGSIPDATVGSFYNRHISGTGHPNPSMTLLDGPDWMYVQGKRLKGTPQAGDEGTDITVRVRWTNSEGTDTKQWLIDVHPQPDPPGSWRGSDGGKTDNARRDGDDGRTITRIGNSVPAGWQNNTSPYGDYMPDMYDPDRSDWDENVDWTPTEGTHFPSVDEMIPGWGEYDPLPAILSFDSGWDKTNCFRMVEEEWVDGTMYRRYQQYEVKFRRHYRNNRIEFFFTDQDVNLDGHAGDILYRTSLSTWWKSDSWGSWEYLREQQEGLVMYVLDDNGSHKDFEDVAALDNLATAVNGQPIDRKTYGQGQDGFREVYVRGTVVEPMTLCSESDVYISGNLVADEPTDTFGLVTEDDVFVLMSEKAEADYGDDDYTDPLYHENETDNHWGVGHYGKIDAAIYAIDDFTYRQRHNGDVGAELSLFGSFVWNDDQTLFGEVYQVRHYTYNDALSTPPPSFIAVTATQPSFKLGTWDYGF